MQREKAAERDHTSGKLNVLVNDHDSITATFFLLSSKIESV